MPRDPELVRQRLIATGLAAPPDLAPAEVVRRLGCVQGQDLPGVIASIALRTQRATGDTVRAAMDAGEIVRGYPMRGTVFAVHAEDLAWMSALTAPRMQTEIARRRASQGLDDATVDRVRTVALDPLADAATRAEPAQGQQRGPGLTRAELAERWSDAGLPATAASVYHHLSTLMIEGHACYGPWDPESGQQRIVDAAGWLPAGSTLEARFAGERIPAIAEWLGRYLASHGPATLRDFAWWTKLPLAELRHAAREIPERYGLEAVDDDGERRWARPGVLRPSERAALGAERPMLLPGFDELVLGYPDRGFLLSAAEQKAVVPGGNGMFRGVAIDRLKPLGTWRRATGAKRALELAPFGSRPIPKRAQSALERLFAAHGWLAPGAKDPAAPSRRLTPVLERNGISASECEFIDGCDDGFRRVLGGLDGVQDVVAAVWHFPAELEFGRDVEWNSDDYLQCAGAAERLVAERHVTNEHGRIEHVVLGRAPATGAPDARVEWLGDQGQYVHPEEVWTAEELAPVFAEYARTRDVPAWVATRRIEL